MVDGDGFGASFGFAFDSLFESDLDSLLDSVVEVLDGTARRATNVQVGISSGDSNEIISGLAEGQVVLLSAF